MSRPNVNVGCGGGSYALWDLGCEVNCDIEKVPKKIRNFVQCDVQFMPFRCKSFQTAYASHILEHVCNYKLAVRELKRISEKTVLIYPFFLHINAYLDIKHKWVIVSGRFFPIHKVIHCPMIKRCISAIFWITRIAKYIKHSSRHEFFNK